MNREQYLRVNASAPWCLHGDHFAMMIESMAAGEPVGGKMDGEYVHPQIETFGDIAYVPVRGMLLKGVSMLDAYFYGDYDVDLLGKQLRNIANDTNVKKVVIDIDSPGGVAMGIESVAQQIADLRKSGKKVYAYSGGMCCSAAYFLVAGADMLLGSVDSIWGSISTYSAGVDSSKAWEKEGRELVLYRTGELKAVGLPGKAWTDEEKAAIKERVDAIDGDFKGFVKANRPQVDAAMMNGNHWYARHSPPGLIDGIVGSVNELIEYLLTV